MSLDDTLAAWADAVRLPATATADIYRQIIMTPAPARTVSPGLDPAWWRRHTAGFTVLMVTSTRFRLWAA
jgi:hypothetical protein